MLIFAKFGLERSTKSDAAINDFAGTCGKQAVEYVLWNSWKVALKSRQLIYSYGNNVDMCWMIIIIKS